jgi:hypothetical protein
MTIKAFVFETHQYCQAHIAAPFKRTHIYELLATAFGYNSFAALSSQSFLGYSELGVDKSIYTRFVIRNFMLKIVCYN